MHFTKFTLLACLSLGWCAPIEHIRSDLARDNRTADESVVYPDYRRAVVERLAQPASQDESVVYPDYRRAVVERVAEPASQDESVVYPDYRRALVERVPETASEDEAVVYPDYRRAANKELIG